ncbi:MAG: hypothetical protein H6822_00555 [Planctomycetaceae bacterium]|nr:hypothetical protein [Planctomycetales bacterium]MCB9920635.1 hypothetical protein [Planctomycetaceae bacterium]
MVLLLDKQGAAIAGNDYLPINIRGNAGWLTLTEARRGLLVVTELVSQMPIVDVPVWYIVHLL